MRVKFRVLKQTERLHLHAKFHLNVFIVSASGCQKPQFRLILTFGGFCTDLLLPMRAKSGVLQLTHSTRLRVKFCLDQFILSLFGGEKPQFLEFFGLRHLVMSTVGGNLRKLNTGAQLQTFPFTSVTEKA